MTDINKKEMEEVERWMDDWLAPGKGHGVSDSLYRKVRGLPLRDESRSNKHFTKGGK